VEASGKARKLSDGAGRVLEARRTGAGWWRLRYWCDGNEGMLSLGTYPETGLRDARDKRDAARKLVAAGEAMPGNPAADLQDALKPVHSRHHAAIVEPKEAGALLRDVLAYEGHPVTRAALQLSALLLLRPGELRQMEWAWVDLDGAMLMVPTEVIEAQLAHAVGASLGRAYNRTPFAEQRRDMMGKWADYLDRLRGDAPVIPMAGKRAWRAVRGPCEPLQPHAQPRVTLLCDTPAD